MLNANVSLAAPPMDFALIVDLHHPDQMAGAARLAEKHEFSCLWVPDSPALFPDVYVTLVVAATGTHRIRLGPCVTNPVTRHPSTIANAILTLEQLAKGRVILGIGRGDSAVRSIGRAPARSNDLRNAVRTIHECLTGRHPLPHRVPIFLAASGPRTLRLAGELADGVIATVGAAPSLVAEARVHVEEGLRIAGRSGEAFRFVLNVNCALDCDDRSISAILPSIAAKVNYGLPSTSLPHERAEHVRRLREVYTYADHQTRGARHTGRVQPWMVERFAIMGTPETCSGQFQALAASGVDEVIVDPGNTDLSTFVERFHREVLSLMSPHAS